MSKIILGADVGYGNLKAVWNSTNTDTVNPENEIVFRSIAQVSHNPDNFTMDGSSGLDRVLVPVDGAHYIVGPDATITGGTRTLDPDYVNRGEYRALLAGAMHYMMKSMKKLTPVIDVLVVGLPVSSYQQKKQALRAVASSTFDVPVPESLKKFSGVNIIKVKAEKVIVLPQPLGALRLALDASMAGDLFAEEDEVNLVIDPGYNTFDWFLSRGMDAQFEKCGSFPGGVSAILQEVSHAAGMKLGTGDINFADCERALETGRLNIGGNRVDFSPYRVVATQAAQSVVDQFLNSLNPERIGVQNIYLSGGGAMYYLEPLRRRLAGFNITVQPSSVMANARGYWLFGNEMAKA